MRIERAACAGGWRILSQPCVANLVSGLAERVWLAILGGHAAPSGQTTQAPGPRALIEWAGDVRPAEWNATCRRRRPRSGHEAPTSRASRSTSAGGAALAAFLLVSAGLFLVLREKAPVVEVTTVRADKGGRPALLNASGYVTPRRRATIAAKITARVNDMFAEEGMHVEPGQILAVLDDSDARARLGSAKADRDATAATLGDLRVNLANAERELQRTEELWKRGLAAEQARDLAHTAVESLKARIALVREQVGAAEARVQVSKQ